MNDRMYFFSDAALKTIVAEKADILKAKVFGSKHQQRDEITGTVVTTYHYKGHIYVTDLKSDKENS